MNRSIVKLSCGAVVEASYDEITFSNVERFGLYLKKVSKSQDLEYPYSASEGCVVITKDEDIDKLIEVLNALKEIRATGNEWYKTRRHWLLHTE